MRWVGPYVCVMYVLVLLTDSAGVLLGRRGKRSAQDSPYCCVRNDRNGDTALRVCLSGSRGDEVSPLRSCLCTTHEQEMCYCCALLCYLVCSSPYQEIDRDSGFSDAFKERYYSCVGVLLSTCLRRLLDTGGMTVGDYTGPSMWCRLEKSLLCRWWC